MKIEPQRGKATCQHHNLLSPTHSYCPRHIVCCLLSKFHLLWVLKEERNLIPMRQLSERCPLTLRSHEGEKYPPPPSGWARAEAVGRASQVPVSAWHSKQEPAGPSRDSGRQHKVCPCWIIWARDHWATPLGMQPQVGRSGKEELWALERHAHMRDSGNVPTVGMCAQPGSTETGEAASFPGTLCLGPTQKALPMPTACPTTWKGPFISSGVNLSKSPLFLGLGSYSYKVVPIAINSQVSL